MSEKNFAAKIVDFVEKKLWGFKVSTNLQNATTDCPELWMKSIASLHENEITQLGDSYGISVMSSPGTTDFDYWAAFDCSDVKKLTTDMQEIALDPGIYIECQCASISEIGAAYQHLYQGDALQANSDYIIDMTKPCFELYPQGYCIANNPKLLVYAPLKKKS